MQESLYGREQAVKHSERMEVLQDWLEQPETQEKLRSCVQAAVERIEADTSLRVPRTEEERGGAFAAWLHSYQKKIGPEMQEQFRQQFPGIAQSLRDPDTIKSIVEEQIWPDVAATLISYAVRGLASDWVRRNIGDAVLVGMPHFSDRAWNVPLAVIDVGENLGHVVMDTDGNIIARLTSSREALREAIHDRRLQAVAASAGQ